MAKKVEKKENHFNFPFTKTNFLILVVGIIVLIVGYIFMSIPTNPDAFMTKTLSPILLVIAYLVIIPIGLFYRPKRES